MTALYYLAAARFHGPDASQFLQSQLSADITSLDRGEATWACYCSPRGQVIGLLLVCREGDEYRVVAATGLLSPILDRLQTFVFRSRVDFSALQNCTVFGVAPGEDIPGHRVFQPQESGPGYVFVQAPAQANENAQGFREQELRNRITWLGPETSEKYIPQVLGYDRLGAVSFTKGCYPGQEIIARTRYLGRIKRSASIVQVWQELEFSPMDRVRLRCTDAWLEGDVVDSVSEPALGTLCFIVAPTEAAAGAQELEFQGQSYRCATM